MSQASWNEELLDDEQFLALNAIYLRKMAPLEHITGVTGLQPARARELLAIAESDGSIIDVGGQSMLSDAGRQRVLAYYRSKYGPARESAAVQAWYGRFETVNAQFISLVTRWQTTDGDERIQEQLVRLVERQAAALGQLAAEIPRYARYAERFEDGLSRIDSGQRDYVCKPTIDSVHNVWFEFHEDILAVLGRPRET